MLLVDFYYELVGQFVAVFVPVDDKDVAGDVFFAVDFVYGDDVVVVEFPQDVTDDFLHVVGFVGCCGQSVADAVDRVLPFYFCFVHSEFLLILDCSVESVSTHKPVFYFFSFAHKSWHAAEGGQGKVENIFFDLASPLRNSML